jgi:serine/threonine-protein kinase
VKIFDFSVARAVSPSPTGVGNIFGTPDYMSPERVKGRIVDGRADLFSAGCTLYEMLCGRPPFRSDNVMAIFYKVIHDEPNYDLIPAGPGHEALLSILKRALAKSLDDRYPDARSMHDDLSQVAVTLGVPA